MTALEVRNLSKRYGDHAAVTDLSFSVAEGSLTCLVGPSGCGKTTALRCVAGLLSPDAGRITIGDRIVFSKNPRLNVRTEDRGIGLVFQDYALWPHMSVRQHLRFPMESRGLSRSQHDPEVMKLLRLVQLENEAERRPSELSGGQQQRTALARALACAPGLLLMDEPMSNLDPRLRQQMRGELVRLLRGSGVATLYVTHDQAEAMSIADQIIVLRNGRLIQQGAPTAVYEHPADLGVADFLGIGQPIDAESGGAQGSILLAGRFPTTLPYFDTSRVARVVVPISAAHAADSCSAATPELTAGAVVRTASYEGGAWLLEAVLAEPDQKLSFRADQALPPGRAISLHLVSGRLLPFTAEGALCPSIRAENKATSPSEVPA